jgi:probable HAF family extracellular repeat protein
MHNCSLQLALTLCCALLAAQPITAQRYAVTDLGTLPSGVSSQAAGINQSGQVTGTSFVFSASTGVFHESAFLYKDGKMIDLGSLGIPGSNGFGITGDEGKDTRDRDERERQREIRVTGEATVGERGPSLGEIHAFLYEDGFMKDLGLLPGGSFSVGQGVNRSGEVAGQADNAKGALRAFLYKDGTMLDLGTLGGPSAEAFGINDRGDVTGVATKATGGDAFLYRDGKMIDLGTFPGGQPSFALAINNARQITGFAGTAGSAFHAFLWSNGKMIDLGVLPTGETSSGYAINSSGQVAGVADVLISSSHQYVNHAFLYSDGKMQDLNTLIPPNSGWILQGARGINDRGEIVGEGTINGGNVHAYLLTLKCHHGDDDDTDREPCRKER